MKKIFVLVAFLAACDFAGDPNQNWIQGAHPAPYLEPCATEYDCGDYFQVCVSRPDFSSETNKIEDVCLTGCFVDGKYDSCQRYGHVAMHCVNDRCVGNPLVKNGCSGTGCDDVSGGCQYDSDCPTGTICQNGVCVSTGNDLCVVDSDCPSGYVCQNGECVYNGGGNDPPSGSVDVTISCPVGEPVIWSAKYADLPYTMKELENGQTESIPISSLCAWTVPSFAYNCDDWQSGFKATIKISLSGYTLDKEYYANEAGSGKTLVYWSSEICQ